MTDDPQSVLDSLRKQKWADARTTHFAARATVSGDVVHLTGDVLTGEQRAEAEQAIRQAAPDLQVVNDIVVLSRPDSPWALVKRGLSNLRRSPGNDGGLLAQGLFGEAVELLKYDAGQGWWFARLEDGYLGWLVESSLFICDRDQARAYRAKADALVEAELATTYSGLLVAGGMSPVGLHAGKLPFGVPVRVAERRLARSVARVNWEGEPPLWLAKDDLLPMTERPHPDDAGIARTLDLMSRFIGVPYLWGGETPFGYDCSGFAQTTMEFMGLHVPRDADMQYRAGQPVEGEPRPGDLVFFSSKSDDSLDMERFAFITHVAVTLGGTEFIHSTGHAWGVTRNSLDPASPIYRAWLKEHLAGVRRFV